MSNIVIKATDISKQYRLGVVGSGSLKDDLARFWAQIRGKEDPTLKVGQTNDRTQKAESDYVWALKDINFEVRQGEILGIIGKNGAGKSTLLKILSKITAPTTGSIKVKGRIASLLEVGTGFHQELTGRENIYLNGAILGMQRHEVTRKLDEIVAFAGIEKYVDTPVKRYSSGMTVRLGFAVAAHLEPEILVVDEVLAVGDAEFQKKAIGKMQDVSSQEGRTILFVSHQMDMVRSLCKGGILLRNGSISKYGKIEDIVDIYLSSAVEKNQLEFEIEKNTELDIQVTSGRIFAKNKTMQDNQSFDIFDTLILELEYSVRKNIKGALINFDIKKGNQTIFLSFDTDTQPNLLDERKKGNYKVQIKLPSPLLKSGMYSISIKTGITNVTTFQELGDILAFEVQELSLSTSLASFAEKRAGIVATQLDWQKITN
ncbi:ABC transporter ATP-binding protein [Bernardetia sp.]|uniref:ABC transporter ATP-binding protein n=1 Tax=Bernardetia sp. TaxID=1937974 RepID=UPI0025C14331|nr:ABC transporter ATP-binding protein [Bernardetia sp.]